MNIVIKKTTLDNLEEVMSIYSKAREYMKSHNNPNQWGDNFPTKDSVIKDINNKLSNLVIDNETKDILGVFTLLPNHDPSYDYIYGGHWISDKEYNTIHKVASAFIVKDFTKIVFDYVKSLGLNIRIDTHEDNLTMQRQVLKYGFVYCGKIVIDRGEERLAYEFVNN